MYFIHAICEIGIFADIQNKRQLLTIWMMHYCTTAGKVALKKIEIMHQFPNWYEELHLENFVCQLEANKSLPTLRTKIQKA